MLAQQSHATKNGSLVSGHDDACARAAGRFAERWLRIYAERKLRCDPIFAAAYELLRESNLPLLDLGCGVGLLGFYLRERNFGSAICGIDRDGRKIARARAAARDVYRELDFKEQDVSEPMAQTGNVVLFDLLHYLLPNDQSRLLERLGARVAADGILMIRDCPRDENARFWLTHLAERFAQTTTWNINVPLHYPTRDQICAAFPEDQFSRTIRPLWGRTLFNNHLFVFRRCQAAVAPA